LVETPGFVELLERSLTREPRGAGRAAGPTVAWASTRGLVRTESQDRIGVVRSGSGLIVAVLADGKGGMRDGARAAIIATAAMATHCAGSPTANVESVLSEALRFANEQVFRARRGRSCGCRGPRMIARRPLLSHTRARPAPVPSVSCLSGRWDRPDSGPPRRKRRTTLRGPVASAGLSASLPWAESLTNGSG
jgi:hypothetical protein